ncbi:hypothetical protein [Rickettsia oklahomensis]|uniref:Uncharacterized protein n=1 Tax=Rickettsia oklahomensis TaxID=3141789 RepID=A0AAU7BYV4_9RICK
MAKSTQQIVTTPSLVNDKNVKEESNIINPAQYVWLVLKPMK